MTKPMTDIVGEIAEAMITDACFQLGDGKGEIDTSGGPAFVSLGGDQGFELDFERLARAAYEVMARSDRQGVGASVPDRAGHEPSQSSLSRPVGDHPSRGNWPNPAPDASPSMVTTGVAYSASISAADRVSSRGGLPSAEQAALEQLCTTEPRTVPNAAIRKALEARGLIRSEPFGPDSKGYISHLTEAGARVAKRKTSVSIDVAVEPFGDHGLWLLTCSAMPRFRLLGKSPDEVLHDTPICIAGLVNEIMGASADRSPEGQDAEERLDRNDESAVPQADAQQDGE